MTEIQKIVDDIYKLYIYAYPLIVLDLHTKALTNTEVPTATKAPLNQYLHGADVAKAQDREIVHPNIDTVYSKAHMNLKDGPLYIHKPEADRYAAAEIIDAYGNCIANLGSGEIGGNGEVKAVLVGPDYHGEVPEELIRIDVPTNACWTLTRILKNGNDESQIKRIQQGFYIRPVAEYKNESYVPPKGSYNASYDFIPYDKLEQITVEEFFSIFNEMIGDNLGKNPDQELLVRGRKYGIGAGLEFRSDVFDSKVQKAFEGFYKRIVQDFDRELRRQETNWEFEKPECDGKADFKWSYLKRARVAWGGFGALPARVAIYPRAFWDEDGRELNGEEQYICHFYSEPPVKEFWSLTAYGEDQFLIPNELDRNGFNDRSKLKKNPDGSFDIYLQRDRPEEEKVDNWLPIGAGKFELVLRVYYAMEEFLDGEWKMPRIVRSGE